MTLSKKALDLSCKILVDLEASRLDNRLFTVKSILETAFTQVYIKARHDEREYKPWDPLTQVLYDIDIED